MGRFLRMSRSQRLARRSTDGRRFALEALVKVHDLSRSEGDTARVLARLDGSRGVGHVHIGDCRMEREATDDSRDEETEDSDRSKGGLEDCIGSSISVRFECIKSPEAIQSAWSGTLRAFRMFC